MRESKWITAGRHALLLLFVAISLVVGILGNLLFVMTGGGSLLSRF